MSGKDGVSLEMYSASWCNPCKGMAPVIEELRAAGWNITKIDVDHERDKAIANGVQAVPTYLIYKEGRVVRRLTGAQQRFSLETELRLARDS